MKKITIQMDLAAAVEKLLSDQYFSEFVVIDGLSRHPQGLNFYEWLHYNNLITFQELLRLTKELEEHSDELEEILEP